MVKDPYTSQLRHGSQCSAGSSLVAGHHLALGRAATEGAHKYPTGNATQLTPLKGTGRPENRGHPLTNRTSNNLDGLGYFTTDRDWHDLS